MSKRTPSQETIDLDFSDYARAPRSGLGLYMLGYFGVIALLIFCMWELWA